MKALLTTIVDNINFGTYLQTYATVKVLNDFGIKTTVLNYQRPYTGGNFYAKNYLKRRDIPKYKQISLYLFSLSMNRFMKWKISRFIHARVPFSKKISSLDELTSGFSGYDLYVTGSDQVWNCEHNFGLDPIFFFKGIQGKKVSYAASVGTDRFPEKYQDKIKELLSDYSVISTRERQGVEALAEIGITDATHVLDPTLLLNKDEWLEVAGKSHDLNEKYLLVYSVEIEKNNDIYNIAKRIADERGLKIYLVSATLSLDRHHNFDKVFRLASCETFIRLFANAEYVVCSSFHGTAFAINFNKQFVTVAPGRFSSRVNSLLGLVSLESRYIDDISNIPADRIDFNKVSQILDSEIEKSITVIKRFCTDDSK